MSLAGWRNFEERVKMHVSGRLDSKPVGSKAANRGFDKEEMPDVVGNGTLCEFSGTAWLHRNQVEKLSCVGPWFLSQSLYQVVLMGNRVLPLAVALSLRPRADVSSQQLLFI